jgi:hypothetical protein
MLHDQQQELKLVRRRGKTVTPEDVKALVSVLSGRDWTKAKALIAIVASRHNQIWTDRRIRATAHASKGHIISGQQGYKVTNESTVKEIQHAAAWLRHQANEMTARAVEIDRVYHGKEGAHAQ